MVNLELVPFLHGLLVLCVSWYRVGPGLLEPWHATSQLASFVFLTFYGEAFLLSTDSLTWTWMVSEVSPASHFVMTPQTRCLEGGIFLMAHIEKLNGGWNGATGQFSKNVWPFPRPHAGSWLWDLTSGSSLADAEPLPVQQVSSLEDGMVMAVAFLVKMQFLSFLLVALLDHFQVCGRGCSGEHRCAFMFLDQCTCLVKNVLLVYRGRLAPKLLFFVVNVCLIVSLEVLMDSPHLAASLLFTRFRCCSSWCWIRKLFVGCALQREWSIVILFDSNLHHY